jgi:hypothetical protein
VEAGSGDDAVGAHVSSRDRTLLPRVPRGERHPRRARRNTGSWRSSHSHFECGNAFFRGGREAPSPMHDAREGFACGAVSGCIIVARGLGLKSAELYDTELNRWLRLPCDLPYEAGLSFMGSAVL